MIHVFDRSGLASLDDFEAAEYKNLFSELEIAHSQFLSSGKQFRSKSYKWPINPLMTWSRCWEYPYILYHIRKWRKNNIGFQPTVVDLGCGVTFMPFSIARENCAVIGVDIDPVAERDLCEAANIITASPGSVSFKLTNGESLPFQDNAIDAIYCISVLEHIADPCKTIKEVARVIKKGGLFVLTIDIDLKGNHDLGPDTYHLVLNTLREYFVPQEVEETIHPLRLLTSDNGPYPLNVEFGLNKVMRPFKEFVKLLIGRERRQNLDLACYGTALIRK
jgi:SAM-dependent methyltransferase